MEQPRVASVCPEVGLYVNQPIANKLDKDWGGEGLQTKSTRQGKGNWKQKTKAQALM